MQIIERWKPIPSHEGLYDISNIGRVFSLRKGIYLKPRIVRGYAHVTLQDDCLISQRAVHRLVAKAFVPNPHGKPVVNHLDGNKQNNAETNLEWVTASENSLHAFRTGLQSNRGERNSMSVLTDADIAKIRERLRAGETCVAIAADYPVTDRAVSRIKRGIVWSHI